MKSFLSAWNLLQPRASSRSRSTAYAVAQDLENRVLLSGVAVGEVYVDSAVSSFSVTITQASGTSGTANVDAPGLPVFDAPFTCKDNGKIKVRGELDGAKARFRGKLTDDGSKTIAYKGKIKVEGNKLPFEGTLILQQNT